MTKKIENLKEMKEDELKKKLFELEEEIRSIRFKAEGSKSKNIDKAKQLLYWQPTTNLETGLTHFTEWYQTERL